MDPLHIDGSRGEGGGQILRTSLALAAITGRAVQFVRIRARRRRPGLRQQHLTAVRAAAAICDAEIDGDSQGSASVYFRPGAIRAGDYHFSVGTAGSASLVLQTVLPPLLRAPGPSTVVVEGGTHNPKAPPYEFLSLSFIPALARMGARVELTLERHGFYPAGGGRIRARIEPCPELSPLELCDAGPITARRVRVLLSKLPAHIARRELAVVRERLGWSASETDIEEIKGPHGPANVLLLEVERGDLTSVFTGFGEIGVRAEVIAATAVGELERCLDAGVPVDEHLADQLLLPMALAGAGRFRTTRLTEHSRTNIDVIQTFLDVPMNVDEGDAATTVSVR
jgi:RNA 3'-terminal phosphate cyclase (ATP)